MIRWNYFAAVPGVVPARYESADERIDIFIHDPEIDACGCHRDFVDDVHYLLTIDGDHIRPFYTLDGAKREAEARTRRQR